MTVAGRPGPAGTSQPERGEWLESFDRPVVSDARVVDLADGLARFLSDVVYRDEPVQLVSISTPHSNGASSETVLLEVLVGDRPVALAARVAPPAGAVTVFNTYDFQREARVLERVRRLSRMPVPWVYGYDMTARYIGLPFLLMERVTGRVAPDYPPYALQGWVRDASPEQLNSIESSAVELLAHLFSIEDPVDHFSFLLPHGPINGSWLLADLDRWSRYYNWAAAGCRISLLEEAFQWLYDHLPTHEGPCVVSWGDSRLGNVMFAGYRAVAALDWEIAGLGPPEVDLHYLAFMHEFLEDRIRQSGGTGMPEFLALPRIVERFHALIGYELRDSAWFRLYASVRFTAMAIRVSMRKVAAGTIPSPEDANALIPHRELFAEILRQGGAPD